MRSRQALVPVLLVAALPCLARAQAPLAMRISEVAPRFQLISGYTNGNLLAFVGARSVLMVDAQSARRAPLADSALRTVTTLPVTVIVNTHYHDDHIGGNPYWRSRGARIIAHEQAAVEARKDTVIPEETWHRTAADPAALADQSFRDSLMLDFEGEKVVLLHPPGAHTSGDVMVWFPRANILHTGDILEREAPPFIDWWAGGSVDGMIRAVDGILARVDDRTLLVPGHGTVARKPDLIRYRSMMVTMRDRISAAVAAGKTLAAIQAERPAAEFEGLIGVGWRPIRLTKLFYHGATETAARARAERIRTRLTAMLDSSRAVNRWPGVSVGVAFADGRSLAFTLGLSDTATREPLRPDQLLLAGSVGKTFVAGVALDLMNEGKLSLDQPISTWLATEPWFPRLPNGAEITVRQLLNHTSGLVRYEFKEEFTRDLTANPDRVWRPEELVAYILDTPAPFKAGQGWDYSDTNYIILGMILEKITGKTLYAAVDERILQPLALTRVVPSSSRAIPGLSQGYAGPANPFGGTDAMIVSGKFAINPQFEWAGGGFATATEDLARWGQMLWSGRAFPDSIMKAMLSGVPAKLGPDTQYGLGVIIRPTPVGLSYGHSGFFPGYLTEVRYYKDLDLTVAMQFNTSAPGVVRGLGRMLDAIAAVGR